MSVKVITDALYLKNGSKKEHDFKMGLKPIQKWQTLKTKGNSIILGGCFKHFLKMPSIIYGSMMLILLWPLHTLWEGFTENFRKGIPTPLTEISVTRVIEPFPCTSVVNSLKLNSEKFFGTPYDSCPYHTMIHSNFLKNTMSVFNQPNRKHENNQS